MLIRPAREDEAELLTGLTFRSVQSRGYSDEFMAWEPEVIDIPLEFITDRITNVLEIEGRVCGVYVLSGEPPEIELSRMMIEPDIIGSGCGRLLWDHSVETARGIEATVIVLDADPNAEPFYQRMGAVTVGEHDWEPPMMPGWRVKKMRFDLVTSDM